MTHLCITPFEDEDGWYHARCQCGFDLGPFPDMEDAVDALMDHAFHRGIQEATG